MSAYAIILTASLFLFVFLERGEGRGKEGEKYQLVVSHMPPTGDPACNPGMCPNPQSNQQPFGSQDSAQPIEPHQPGWVQ